MKTLSPQQTQFVTGGIAVVAKKPFGANKFAGFAPMLSEPTKNTSSGWFIASLVEPADVVEASTSTTSEVS
jgi:hypothetical protein